MKWWYTGIAASLGVLIWADIPGEKATPWKRENGYWVQSVTSTIASYACLARTNGPVVVRGVDGPAISCTIRKRVRASSAAEAARIASVIQFRATDRHGYAEFYSNHPDLAEIAVEMEIRAPRGLKKMVVESLAGNIEIYGLDGYAKAETAGGNITVDRVKSNVLLKTGGGEIRVGELGAGARCLSGGGGIHAQKLGGESWLETAGGDIEVKDIAGVLHASTNGGSIRVERAGNSVEARTGGGRIDVMQAQGIVLAENSGGSIHVGSAPGVRCESTGGTIQLRSASGPVRAVTHIGNILAQLMGGLQNSVLSSTNGDITVIIPSKMALTVKAINEGVRPGRIVSEFVEIPVQQLNAPGLPRFQAVGILNGGGPVLVVSANQGTIYLKRQR